MTNQPETPKPSQGSEPLDDFFHATAGPASPGQGGQPGQGGPTPYVPPPMMPGQQRRGPNPVLMIVVGVIIGVLCLCGGCIAITGGGVLAFLNNPTVQAGLGTGFAMAEAPVSLPADATQKGSLTLGQSASAQLGATEQQVWTFKGTNGQTVTITVTPQDKNLYPMLGLYDSNGNRLDKTPLLKGNTNAVLTDKLPADGTYSILVFGLGGTANSNGAYTIVVQ